VTDLSAPQAPTGTERRFGLVAFGTYTRTLTLAHASHVGTVLAALLIMALTLDLAPRAERIAAQAPLGGVLGVVLHMLWYLLLRMCDLLGSLLPLASFMGLYWSEITLTQSRERIVIANGGRSPLQSLVPIVLLGCALGVLQVITLVVLRPAAVAVQIEGGIGSYGERFDRRLSDTRRWLILPDQIVQARIDYRQARLVDVQVFELSDGGRMTGRIAASEAVAGAEPGTWRLLNGSRWTAPTGPSTTPGEARRFAEELVRLPLDPLYLANLGIDARYLPQGILSDLAGRPEVTEASYRAWWHVRIAQAILPLAMMLMASALATTLIGQRTAFAPMILIGLAGYFLYVTNNIAVWLGEYGQLPAPVAAWLMPLAMIVTASILFWRIETEGRR
jgi:lipopolysaccharide export LptBFGC system permease protein LptF